MNQAGSGTGLRGRNAKIIATLGPASSDLSNIRLLAEAGVDIFRLNFSHGEQAHHAQTYQAIRDVEAVLNRPL
ncbi:MAG: pyruvate kinase, partial [Henriciella sp.]